MGPLESFSAFPFESYMQAIGSPIHSNNAIAKQAAQRLAEKKEKKTYAVLRKAGSKELFMAAKNWMPSDDMCLCHSNVTESEVEARIRPRPDWLLIDCQMLAEQGNCFGTNCIPVLNSFLEARSTLLTAKRIHNILCDSDNLEETLPLTNFKRQRNFASATMPEDEVIKNLTETAKAYFHDIRDRVAKRGSRRRVSKRFLLN
ncbi:unnamed protein product [Trichobilharzia regenti]|nr:unnamed protein product [Trichobilharzia regenti]